MNILLKGISAILLQDGNYVVEEKDIYIMNSYIASMDQKPEGFVPDETIDGKDKLAVPGLINCHNHAYMCLFRNCADDLAFSDWLFQNVMPLEDRLVSEDAYWGASLAIMEMIKSGTTCFADMQMHINETTRAVADSGIRAVISRGLVGSGNDEGGKKRLEEAKKEMEQWKSVDRLTFMLGPHAPYTCDQDYLRIVVEKAKEWRLPIHIHLCESRNEVLNMKEQHNCTPIEFVQAAGLFEVPVLAAHCVHVSENDLHILKSNKVSVVTNPISNMKLGNGFAPILKMQSQGINICIGTDGAASNNCLNLFHEMNILALIHKGALESAQEVSAQDTLRFATSNAAKALCLSDAIGSLEVGKKADITILDTNRAQLMPRNNLVSALSYSANGSEVETVIVDGEFVMKQNELKHMDEERIYFEVDKISKRLGIYGK